MARLNAFVGAMQGGGARANQFAVQIFGRNVLAEERFTFMCRSAQIPALTMGEIPVAYRGRQIYMTGDRTYDAWTCTVYNDANYSVRDEVERWTNEIQDIGSTTASIGSKGVYRNGVVAQLDRNNRTIRTYALYDLWPTTLDAIDLAFDTNDAIEEFGVTFRFNYMTAKGGSNHSRVKSSGGGQVGSGPGIDFQLGDVNVSVEGAAPQLTKNTTGGQ